MGFGTLFIGVFLLFNLKAPGYTDLLSGAVMLMAFYKLRGVNRYFKAAVIPTAAFCAVGLAEFVQEIAYIFGGGIDRLEDYVAPIRLLVIGAILIILLYGISDVSEEVELKKTAKGALVFASIAYPIFVLSIITNILYLIFGEHVAIVILRFISVFSILSLLIAALIIIYLAYSNICMPGEENKEYVEKPSKFGFVNRFRTRQEEKNREYAEYRLSQMRKRAERRSGKKKKK